MCLGLRRSHGGREERLLLHFNGHGVPRPSTNGELWVFNRSFTQYIPLSAYDLQMWLGTPCVHATCPSAAAFASWIAPPTRPSSHVSSPHHPVLTCPPHRCHVSVLTCPLPRKPRGRCILVLDCSNAGRIIDALASMMEAPSAPAVCPARTPTPLVTSLHGLQLQPFHATPLNDRA